MGYEKARGAITWVPDGKTPEQVIRKMRGDHTECEETITDLRCQLAEANAKIEALLNPDSDCCIACDVMHECVRRAAHAIAEAMKGKVVWEGLMRLSRDRVGNMVGWNHDYDGHSIVRFAGVPGDMKDGQRVRVTVEEVEDGQGMG